jgi:hypothetical protein
VLEHLKTQVFRFIQHGVPANMRIPVHGDRDSDVMPTGIPVASRPLFR